LWEGYSESRLDHRYLNDHFDDTTVEGLARAIARDLDRSGLISVEVREGDLRFARHVL
jgi:hypothetical protein